jgi:hypothetical protein
VFVMNYFCERESVLTILMLLSENCTQNAMFVSRAFYLRFCNLLFIVAFIDSLNRLVSSKDEELVFYYGECKDTWGGPRDLAGGLCSRSRGSYPYNSWLSSLILSILLL